MTFLKHFINWEVCLCVALMSMLSTCRKSQDANLCGNNLDAGQLRLMPQSLAKVPYTGNERLIFKNPVSGAEMAFLPRQDTFEILKDFAPSDKEFTCGADVFSVRYSGESARLSYRSQEEYLFNVELRLATVRLDSSSPPVFFDLLSVQLHKPVYGAGGSVQNLHSCYLETIASLRGQNELEAKIVARYENFGFRQDLGTYRSGDADYEAVWMVECGRIPRLYYAEENGLIEFTDIDGKIWTFDRFADNKDEFATNITLPDSAGTSVSLADLEEEVVLLVFWASWSLPSRQEQMGTLRPLYNALHERGMEMYSVSLDTDREAWLKAVEEDGLPGIHVSDLDGTGSMVLQNYSLDEIPTVYVLDRELRILSAGLKGEALVEFVEELVDK